MSSCGFHRTPCHLNKVAISSLTTNNVPTSFALTRLSSQHQDFRKGRHPQFSRAKHSVRQSGKSHAQNLGENSARGKEERRGTKDNLTMTIFINVVLLSLNILIKGRQMTSWRIQSNEIISTRTTYKTPGREEQRKESKQTKSRTS